MWLFLLSVCLAFSRSSLASSSEPHYVITLPNYIQAGTEQKVCVTFQDLKGPVDIKIEVERDDEYDIILQHRIDDYQHSECLPFQVPKFTRGQFTHALHVSALGENLNVSETKNIAIQDRDIPCIIHNDKSTYKPGDIVKFHVLSINSNFKALNKQFRSVEIIDSNKNHIAEWLNVTTKQGFAEFSFPLADELAFGTYKINVANGCEKEFHVDKYVPKRFELNISAPSEFFLRDKSFHLDVCGRYTYGKPVEGLIDLSVCLEGNYNAWNYQYYPGYDTSQINCYHLKGEKTDSKGCISRDIDLGHFNFTTASLSNHFKIKSKLTESTTGHSEKASASVNGKRTQLFEFMDCKSYYVKNSTYHCKVKVRNEMGQPKVNEDIIVYIYEDESDNFTHVNLVTDSNGIAEFTLKTSEWKTHLVIKARLSSDVQDGENYENIWYYFREDFSKTILWLSPYEPKIESLLGIQKHPMDIACGTDQTVTVEYEIHRKNLNADTDHLDFFCLIRDYNGILSYHEQEVNIKNQGNGQTLHGSFPLSFHVKTAIPMIEFIVFSILPNGETIARATYFFVTPCIQNKVKLTFSEEQVRPGENVNLEITADGGVLCSVRSVDKGYLLDKPHDDSYLLRIGEYMRSMFTSNPYMPQEKHEDREMDLLQIVQEHSLLVFTNTGSNKVVPRMSASKKKTKDADKEIPKGFIRNYFPDTWLFELVAVGSDGHVVLNRSTPHSITRWATDVFCLGKDGLDSVSNVALTTFQPYFIDLIVPFSVVQGEKFTIQALVFNYEKKCILIVVALSDYENLITAQDKEQARCVCEGHSHSFTWDVSAIKLKTLRILVDSGSIDVEGDCKEDVLLVGKDLRTDSVEKTVQVKPKGYEEEMTKTFLLFPADNREAITFAINTPERLVEGSERAHIIIMGDLLANVILNLDEMVNLPDGCGEQNLAKLARYVSTWEYLESTEELTPEIKVEAIEAMTKGYQTQLTHRTENGSYSMFHGDPSIWLTAFVIKVFNGAKKVIHIDEKEIQESVNWLQSKQLPNGCFEVIGYYFNNNLEEDAEITCTAYVTIALLEHQMSYNGNIVENALSCLRNSLDNVTSVYTRALLAYAFTLSGDNELRHQTLDKLKQIIVKEDDFGAVETASYVVLSLLSDKVPTMENLENSGDIIRWMLKKQNPWGGFGSSQDTTIALQAVAKYGKAIYRKKGDSTVTIRSKSGFEKTVHVDKSNSLFVQTVDLPEIPGEYSISATGEGFLYIQSHLHCNVLPEQNEKGYFSLHINTEPCDWNHASKKKFHVHLDVGYLGKRNNTNMALIIVRMVSGYVPNRESVEKVKKNPLVERTEISAQNVTIYLTTLTHEITKLHFSVEQEAHVDNLQPATAAAIDYYDPDEHTVIEYSAPWDSVVAHCAMSATEREDCGHKAITKEQCEQKGCCFDSSIHETKWCFHHGFKKIESTNQKQ